MTKIKINDINYYYEEVGLGEPLLLIAGVNCDVSAWAAVVDKLSQNFRLIMFDNRDVGRTDYMSADYSIDDMGNDTVELIHKLGYNKVNVLGHSMGGAIAQSIAFRHPEVVNKLVICNSIVQLSAVSRAALEFTGRIKQMSSDVVLSLQSIAPWVYSEDYLRYDNNLEKLGELIKFYPFPQRVEGYLRQVFALRLFNSRDYLNQIKHATLIIAGAHDPLTPLEQSQIMADNIPNSRLVILPGSHLPIIEAVPSFTKTVQDFLQDD